jgi:hypothetical protein
VEFQVQPADRAVVAHDDGNGGRLADPGRTIVRPFTLLGIAGLLPIEFDGSPAASLRRRASAGWVVKASDIPGAVVTRLSSVLHPPTLRWFPAETERDDRATYWADRYEDSGRSGDCAR